MDPDRRDRMDIGDPVVEEQTELASTVEGNTGQVNKVMTRGKVEEIRKNKMSVNERMMTEYALITKAFKDCRDKVKGQTSLRTSGEVTVVNELFKGAIKEADKAWESVVTAVNTALDGNAANKRESNFLKSVQLESLEQVETEMGENREELRQFRLLLDNVRELELVDDIPSLLTKVNEEREAAEKKYSEWEAMRLELQELNELAELKENDRLVDYWKDMNIELQTIREQFKELKLKIEKGEDDALVLVDSVEMLEKQVAVLEKEKRKLKDINDEQLARLIQAEDSNQEDEGAARMWRTFTVATRFEGESSDRRTTYLHDSDVGSVLRTIPVEEKEKGVKCVLKWLRSRLSNETPFEMIELDKMLRHQKVNGKTVGKVCEELEEWTARLHREEDKKEEARRRQLLILYEGRHTEHVRLLTLFREGSSYSEMKAALVDLEYLRKTEKESKGYSKGFTTGIKCFRCNEYGHKESQNLCNSRNGNGGGSKGGNGTSGGTNGSYRGGYSGPSRGGYSTGRGGYNNGSGQKPQQSNGYGNGGARAHSVAAAANNGRPYTNVGTGANSGPLGHNSSVNAIKTESFSRRGTEVQRHESPERSVRDVEDFFFIKRRELVKGKVNGVPVQVLLDTGADVSIISADVVDKIDGAVVEKGASPMIKDASNGVMDIVGRTILEVELEVGNRTQVGFYVLNNGLGKVIIGGKGLDDVGVELKEVRFREKTHSNGDDAIVLRDAQIGPGQLGSIWVKGSEHNTVMLESSVDQLMEGIAVTERIVHIPVFNDTESELKFTNMFKRQNVCPRILRWAAEMMPYKLEIIHVKGKDNVVADALSRFPVDSYSDESTEPVTIGEDVVINAMTRFQLSAEKQRNNNDEVIREREENILRWETAQGSDEWVQEMIQKKSEIAIGRGDASEMTRMPDSTRKLTMADLEIDNGILYNEVNERLKGERERMKASYDKKWENNKKYEPVVGDRVYVFKEKGDGKNPKLRIRRLIDRQSPLHWENPCPACEENPRPLSALWRACPKEFASFTCSTLKEYACLRTIIEKFRNITPLRVHKLLAMGQLGDEEISEKTIEETVGNLCSHALVSLKGPDREWRFTVTDIDPRYEEAYRRGGDKARWQWKVEMHSKWNEILAGWHRLQTKKTIKNLLIFWPRTMEKEDMNALRDIVVYHTERNAWNVVIVEEPCGGATNPDYIPFLLDWSVDYPKTGKIRVIITDNAITDGTPISALERCHSWIRRDHYEFATQAWVGGMPWDIKKAEKELVEKGWSLVEDTRKRDRSIGESDVSKLSQVLQDRDRREKEEITCKGCEGVGHKIWKCPNKNNNKKIYYGRGRPASKEGDVMEPTHKKKRY
ncbi:hypothetical protein PRIPAC_96436 [Pristionchus pacificus]|uniref:Peptidase A2 domain-containing protein n=1 Tax=Pristionchus pacificus TaxID=54126 RepID=A0A2A6BJR2_PRIPA|nr:hypothetical protein PRIPAC_96436 [Pristionchus pacificus]|eukprot:PDM66031.1 hypothetical protein PRIPAC_44125 [Pristionchus pacificus]